MQTNLVSGNRQTFDLTCPINKEPLFEAMTLSPCACKVNKSSISELMDTAIGNGWKMKPGSICPVVSTHSYIKKAFNDPFVRDIARTIFKGVSSGEPSVAADFTPSQVPQIPVSTLMPYPGEKAVMKHVEGDWTPFTDISGICRKLVLKSETPASLLKEFRLCGFVHGDLRIHIKFDPSMIKQLTQYFSEIGINLKFQPKWKEQGLYWTSNKRELQCFFKEFSRNNKFPEQLLQKIEKVVSQGRIEPQFPYPGKPAMFKMEIDAWEKSADKPVPLLTFKSETPNSLVHKLIFVRKANGGIETIIEYKQEFKKQIIEYFEKLGLNLQNNPPLREPYCYLSVNEITELKVLGNALLANNTFPKEYLKQVRQIIAQGKGAPYTELQGSPFGSPFGGHHAMFELLGRLNEGLRLHRASQMPANAPTNPGAYPGKPSTFVHSEGDWEQIVDKLDVQRHITFDAQDSAVLIPKFELVEYKSNHVRIAFKFQTQKIDQVTNFFKDRGVKLQFGSLEKLGGYYKSCNKQESLAIFNIIAENNTFPQEHKTKIKEIIEKSPDDELSSEICRQQ